MPTNVDDTPPFSRGSADAKPATPWRMKTPARSSPQPMMQVPAGVEMEGVANPADVPFRDLRTDVRLVG